MSIEQLPPPTQTRLRSTQILTSFTQIVSELLQNSLDANPQRVDVGVDCEEWECWASDDGVGISREALSVIGQGQDVGRYNTSKCYAADTINALETFGFRGEALASIADLSCLEICSRTARSKDTWSVIVKGGKNLYNGSAVRWRRESKGTTVHVRDAFYNLPVRRRSHPPPARILEQIRHDLEVYALIFPSVSFSFRNLRSQRGAGSSRDSTWHIPKASDIEVIDLVSGDMKLNGFISLAGAPSKMYQFLYVNKYHLSQCDLHRVIDSIFAASSFYRDVISRRSPRKGEKRPVYVLNLTMPPERIDNCLEPTKSAIHIQDMRAVSTFLASAIQGFLASHGYSGEAANSEPPQKKRKIQGQQRNDDFELSGATTDPVRRTPPPCIDLNHDSKILKWKDDRTGQTFLIDSRTGNTFAQALAQPKEMNLRLSDYREERRTLSSQTTIPEEGSIRASPPDWLIEALKGGRQTESLYPSHRFERSDLRRAEVIGQVDCKFVACLIRGTANPLDCESPVTEHNTWLSPVQSRLILLDQHAADERIRVERFLKELCQGFLDNGKYGKNGIKVHDLVPPMPLLLTRHEGLKLATSRDLQQFFEGWGIRFSRLSDVETNGTEPGANSKDAHDYLQVLVQCIPRVISDKLTTKDELRNLVKAILGRPVPVISGLNDNNNIPDTSGDNCADEFSWLSGLRFCPQELIDLINSKACRGAIMFNDSLNIEQCENLVSQLSETVFPFQCAHGR
ncbi:hypothetical protein M378DRAFT_183827 [Amanita muscaria Koide BX008]|uniref:MutL C-terminal dimerisation domain-containing protein n=1 Tax=Amanita muscaria (strain Koide BX008) TaxID=946122 RepID=A0A0C2XMB3_AMAMK|nr:hypothetical protein M378DRAFT_183827 [Amanita muscaria Koide BX008]